MNCKTCQNNMLLRATGELPLARIRDTEAHLVACPACRDQVAAQSRFLRLYDESRPPATPVPDATRRAVVALAAQTSFSRPATITFPRALFALAATFLIALSLFLAWRQIQPDAPSLANLDTPLPWEDPLDDDLAQLEQTLQLATLETDADPWLPEADDLESLARQLLELEEQT